MERFSLKIISKIKIDPMNFLNEYIIKNRFIAKIKALIKLLKSGTYIVITIDRNSKNNIENMNFQFNVTDTELEFYVLSLIEFRKKSNILIEDAKKIMRNN